MVDQADVLMNLMLITLATVALAAAASAFLGDGKVSRRCKPHRWSVHPETNKYQCTECGYVAGTDFEPRE